MNYQYTQSDCDRFDSKMKKGESGCWEWIGCKSSKRYGCFSLNRQRVYAHCFAYYRANHTIDPSLDVDHECNNKVCVNPEHLKQKTRKENVLRGESIPATNARKTHCIRGHKFTKANTYIRKNGGRTCMKCLKEYYRKK